jgi:hypothetical protein
LKKRRAPVPAVITYAGSCQYHSSKLEGALTIVCNLHWPIITGVSGRPTEFASSSICCSLSTSTSPFNFNRWISSLLNPTQSLSPTLARPSHTKRGVKRNSAVSCSWSGKSQSLEEALLGRIPPVRKEKDHQGVEHRNLSLHVQALGSIFDKILCSRSGASIRNQRQRQTAQESSSQFLTTLGYRFLPLQPCNCNETPTNCKFATLRK